MLASIMSSIPPGMMRSSGERTLLLTLKEQGSALRAKARPCSPNLEPEKMQELKKLPDKAMESMN